eukprot:scaffold79349_cov55-Phaeocystis_antarctica.AAC.4
MPEVLHCAPVPWPPGRVKPLHQIRTSTPRVHGTRTARDCTHGYAERVCPAMMPGGVGAAVPLPPGRLNFPQISPPR